MTESSRKAAEDPFHPGARLVILNPRCAAHAHRLLQFVDGEHIVSLNNRVGRANSAFAQIQPARATRQLRRRTGRQNLFISRISENARSWRHEGRGNYRDTSEG